MKYRVTLIYDCTETVDVEAEDLEAAREQAHESSRATLCHYCSNHLNLGDAYKAIVSDMDGNELDDGE